MYVSVGGAGYWTGAVRDANDPERAGLMNVLAKRVPFAIDLLNGDQQGRQHTISRFAGTPDDEGGWYCRAIKHWNLDHRGPR
jgi:hypothetical protein